MKVWQENGQWIGKFNNVEVAGSDKTTVIQSLVEARIKQMYLLDSDKLATVPPPFEELQTWSVATVKVLAEEQRGLYITNKPGKILEYVEKQAEYKKWDGQEKPPTPTADDFPMAEKEAVEYGYSTAEMLAVWGEKADANRAALGDISAVSRKAILGIGRAKTEGDIAVVMGAIAWPEP